MPTNRRQFFGLLGAGVVAAAAGSHRRSQAFDAARDARQAFAFDEDHVPMNAANLCPSPRRVAEAVTRYTSLIDEDCSFQNRDRFNALRENSRSAIAAPLGVSAEEIALVRNTSEANNIVSAGIDLAPRDEVLLWEQNHPSNNVAWDVRAARTGAVVRRVSLPAAPATLDDLLDPFLRALSPRTRVLAVTHISNVSGLKVPVAALGEICRARDIHFHIDGAQTWGAVDLNLREVGCDSFSASAHKWFMGPKEVGMLYVHEAAQERLWPSVVSYGWGADEESDLAGARKFESLGQRDDAALAALADTAAMHEALGPAAVAAHATTLATRLKEGLSEAGIPLVTPMSPDFSGAVCIASIAREQRSVLFEGLYRDFGIIAAPTGGLRLCPHVYNTPEHIDRAVAGAASLYAQLS
ncbi:MAG: aminotransferase class V-fold PLP-dependent enzyme [Pseudomonadota bacterium]